MLHKETVEPGTLELLKYLQSEPLLSSFNLVGGTALALRIGHRKSVDLDLFTRDEFDLDTLKSMLVEKYGFRSSFERGYTLKGFIDGVMIDCIRFDYPHLQNPDILEDIRLESIPEILYSRTILHYSRQFHRNDIRYAFQTNIFQNIRIL